MSRPLGIRTLNPVTYQLGGHYILPADSLALWVDEYGNIHGGPNLLLAPHPRGNMQSSVADFLYDQGLQRVCVRSIIVGQLDDPADITFMRFGPTGGYPYAVAANGESDSQHLTGIDTGTGVGQIASNPTAVPFNGDTSTAGGKAVRAGAILNMITAERPRDLTGSEDLAQAMSFSIRLTPTGAQNTLAVFQVDSDGGSLLLGKTALDAGSNGAQLQIRPATGTNDKQTISGSPSGGTWKYRHTGVPAASPKFGGAGAALSGTATTVLGSAAIVGSGTSFTTEVAVGDWLRFGTTNEAYAVAAIPDNTHLTLTSSYLQTGSGGLAVTLCAEVTSALNHNASNDTIQTALEALTLYGTGSALTGTMSLTNNSGAVVGTSTLFTTETRIGDYVRFDGESSSTLYKITAISSPTTATVSPVYAGSTGGSRTARLVSVAVTGGPLPGTALAIEAVGAKRKAYNVPGKIVSSLTGGSYSVSHSTDGVASGDGKVLLYVRAAGQTGEAITATGSYAEFYDPNGNLVYKIDLNGQITGTARSIARATQSVSGNVTLVDRSEELVLVNTAGGAVTVTLPASPTLGSAFEFADTTGNFAVNNLTIGRNAKTINGAAANLTVNTANSMKRLVYVGTGWLAQ